MCNNIIECRHLTHYYGKRMIYEDLNFDVPQGRILGLLGKNGTGKTTTINILSGYLKPRDGQCLIFGQDVTTMDPVLRRRIGLLIENHVQYDFMNIQQIERFYAGFYPDQWRKDAFYGLMEKLKVAPGQKISRMSCGQRSQVALGLILAQNPDLLVLDDFSIGLDPGYRRLFVEYLRDYARSEGKTVFLTSHIIQDMERLVDDCIIMDYGQILTQMPLSKLLGTFHRFICQVPDGYQIPEVLFDAAQKSISDNAKIYHPAILRNEMELFSFLPLPNIEAKLREMGVPFTQLKEENLNLEDVFIGLTGKY